MALLMILVISHCVQPTAVAGVQPTDVAGKLEKPDIQVIFHGKERTGTKVTIECSRTGYKYTGCWFYKNDNTEGMFSSSSTSSGIQHVIKTATAQDEGFYTCECHTGGTSNQYTDTSFRVPLIINDQTDEPDIRIEKTENKITCTRKNIIHKYRLCILYQNGQHIQDTGTKYNNSPTAEVSFTVSILHDETFFECLCYTAEQGWTRNSSAVTKGGKQSSITEATMSTKTTVTRKTKATRITTLPTTTTTGTTSISQNTIIIVVCVLMLFAVLGIIGWLYLSKQKKKKEEGFTRASSDGHNKVGALQDVNSTSDQPTASYSTEQPNTGQDDTGVTYALLNLQAASKPKTNDNEQMDPSVLYASVVLKTK